MIIGPFGKAIGGEIEQGGVRKVGRCAKGSYVARMDVQNVNLLMKCEFMCENAL